MNKFLNRIISVSAACAALFCMTSCLEKYPSSSIPEADAMKTFNDAEQHRRGIYVSMKNPALFSGALTLLPDLQADLAYAVEGNTNTYGSFWRWDFRTTQDEIEAVYQGLYNVIGNCNFFLDNIDGIIASQPTEDDAEILRNYKGEILGVRALCYSELLKCFCEAYDPENAENQLGIVIRRHYSTPEPVKRASLKDSYDFVIRDLVEAESLMDPEMTDYASSFVMTSAAVQALHARIALYMKNYDDAIKYSSIIIDDKKLKFPLCSATSNVSGINMSYFEYMWAYDSGTEILFEIGFTPTSYGGALGTVFFNFQKDYRYFYPDYVPAQWVLDSFISSDKRYEAMFATAEDLETSIGYANGLSTPLLIKYFGNESFMSSKVFQVTMPKILRVAEQYLIRAEAYCAKGNLTAGSKDLTTLRQTRYTNGGSITLGSDWKDVILEERAKELYMEGFRLNDLKRLGKGFQRTPQSCSQPEGSSLKVEAGNYRFVWPFPQHEIEAPGSEIVQNKGY